MPPKWPQPSARPDLAADAAWQQRGGRLDSAGPTSLAHPRRLRPRRSCRARANAHCCWPKARSAPAPTCTRSWSTPGPPFLACPRPARGGSPEALHRLDRLLARDGAACLVDKRHRAARARLDQPDLDAAAAAAATRITVVAACRRAAAQLDGAKAVVRPRGPCVRQDDVGPARVAWRGVALRGGARRGAAQRASLAAERAPDASEGAAHTLSDKHACGRPLHRPHACPRCLPPPPPPLSRAHT